MIWNYCIKRPVFTVVIFLVLAIFGIYGYQHIAVRNFPDVDFPIVNVNVVLPGAEPEVVETEILEPLEEEINTIEGLKTLKSTAREQVGTVTAEFELWRDIDIAVQDVRDRVERARRELPAGIESPIVQKMDPDARSIIWITLQGNNRWKLNRMSKYAENQIKDQLETIQGVGQVQIGGERRYAVRIKLAHDKLAAHQLTIQDVIGAIRANNVDIPSGRIEGTKREFLVKTEGQFSGPEPFNRIIVGQYKGAPVRLEDVGRAVAGIENERAFSRFTGEPAIGLGIVKQSDANTVELAASVKEQMKKISQQFPPGLNYKIASDDSRFIRNMIFDLQTTIGIATLLVIFVIIFFLRSVGGTIISAVSIPTSLAVGFALIYSFNFSMNVLTMLAFILVIGIVVDDAIVVLESSYTELEAGASARPAARLGTTEVAFATIANTLSLGAVFIPVAFTKGMIGRLFFEFGITATVTIFASTFTALTLTPMLCSRFLSVPDKESTLSRWIDNFLAGLTNLYDTLLNWSLDHRWLVVLLALLALGFGIFFFSGLDKEFAPQVDSGEFMISFETPEGATLSETEKYASQLEAALKEMPEVEHFFLAVGLSRSGPGQVNEGMSFVKLIPRDQRQTHQVQLMQEVRERLGEIPGGRAYVTEAGGPGGGNRAPLAVALKHTELQTLARRKDNLVEWMKKQSEFVGVQADLSMDKPQVNVKINRDKAYQLGVSAAQISRTLQYLLGEPDISEIERGTERYEVITELKQQGQTVPAVLKDIYVRSQAGELIALDNLVEIRESVGPSEIGHFNRMRAAIVSASTPPDVVLGEALSKLRSRLKSLPAGFDWETTGQAENMQESFQYLTNSLILGIIFVYLVMSAQFESWLHPLTILATLPLAGVGAYGMLYAFDMTFNVFSFIGTIMLVGLVTKNGILLVDYTNILVERGNDLRTSVTRAGHVRFRPVLMTAISTICGMMPIAFGYGVGGEARAPMGWAVAGGMFSATLLTLVVIPVVYTLLSELTGWICDEPNCLLLYIFGALLVAAGGWCLYLGGFVVQGVPQVTGLVFCGLIAFLFALVLFTRSTFGNFLTPLFALVGLVGFSFWLTPGRLQSIFPQLALEKTGLILLVLGGLGVAVLLLPGTREELGG